MIPTEVELISRAEALVPTLRERAAATEADGRVSAEVAKMLIDAGFYNVAMPRRFGGYGMPPSVLWRITRQIGRGCGSTGWILGLIGVSPWLVGLFEEKAQVEVFGGGNPIVPVMTGGVGRELQATSRLPAGYDISGTWHYGSGVDLCNWAIVMAPVASSGEQGDTRLFLVPKSELEIDHASWNVLGMRGTGSKNVRINGAFVPAHRTISWSAAQRGEFPGKLINSDSMYRMPLNTLFAMSVVAPIVGAGAGAVDHAIEHLQSQVRARKGQERKGDLVSQIEIGHSAGALEMAYALLVADADELQAFAAAGRAFSVADRARYRLHCALISRTVLSAADRLFALAGGSLIQNGGALQRAFRDLHTMTTHFLMQPDITGEVYGRVLLGLELPADARI